MAVQGDSKPKSKHRKSTCAGCRRRKSKCDGKTPKCTTCLAYKDDCQYDKPPSLAYVRSLEEEIVELKGQLRQIKTQTWLNKAAAQVESKLPSPSPPSEAATSNGFLQGLPHKCHSFDVRSDNNADVDDAFGNPLSIAQPTYSNTQTKFRMQSLSSNRELSETQQQQVRDMMDSYHHQNVENSGTANWFTRVGISTDVSQEILKYYWCWNHPLFLFAHRPAFVQGMTMLGLKAPAIPNPFFSETLSKVTHAYGAKGLSHGIVQPYPAPQSTPTSPGSDMLQGGDLTRTIGEEARFGLGMDLLKDSSVPTIQALLQQSDYEVTFGSPSQAWTFAGAAFRMAVDLGIHLPCQTSQPSVNLSVDDREIRKRLFWSFYAWDKILSLYLGRLPGFAPELGINLPRLTDDNADNELWSPYYGEQSESDVRPAQAYAPTPGYTMSCFKYLCRLCIILNDLLGVMYSSEKAAQMTETQQQTSRKTPSEQPFNHISKDLGDWYRSLPAHLRIDQDRMPQLAPPAHIVSLNLLYHSMVILLHRPAIVGSANLNSSNFAASYQACIQATATIHDIIMVHIKTFGIAKVSYLNSFAVYTAATISVLRFERDFQAGQDAMTIAQGYGLFYLLDVLQNASHAMPALRRSSAIIRQRVNTVITQKREQLMPSYHNSPNPSIYTIPTPPNQRWEQIQHTVYEVPSNSALTYGSYSQPETGDSFASQLTWEPQVVQDIYMQEDLSEFQSRFPTEEYQIGMAEKFANDQNRPSIRTNSMNYSMTPHSQFGCNSADWNLD